jgi:hypothetical protein
VGGRAFDDVQRVAGRDRPPHAAAAPAAVADFDRKAAVAAHGGARAERRGLSGLADNARERPDAALGLRRRGRRRAVAPIRVDPDDAPFAVVRDEAERVVATCDAYEPGVVAQRNVDDASAQREEHELRHVVACEARQHRVLAGAGARAAERERGSIEKAVGRATTPAAPAAVDQEVAEHRSTILQRVAGRDCDHSDPKVIVRVRLDRARKEQMLAEAAGPFEEGAADAVARQRVAAWLLALDPPDRSALDLALDLCRPRRVAHGRSSQVEVAVRRRLQRELGASAVRGHGFGITDSSSELRVVVDVEEGIAAEKGLVSAVVATDHDLLNPVGGNAEGGAVGGRAVSILVWRDIGETDPLVRRDDYGRCAIGLQDTHRRAVGRGRRLLSARDEPEAQGGAAPEAVEREGRVVDVRLDQASQLRTWGEPDPGALVGRFECLLLGGCRGRAGFAAKPAREAADPVSDRRADRADGEARQCRDSKGDHQRPPPPGPSLRARAAQHVVPLNALCLLRDEAAEQLPQGQLALGHRGTSSSTLLNDARALFNVAGTVPGLISSTSAMAA